MIHGFNDLCTKSKHYEFTCGIMSDNHSRGKKLFDPIRLLD